MCLEKICTVGGLRHPTLTCTEKAALWDKDIRLFEAKIAVPDMAAVGSGWRAMHSSLPGELKLKGGSYPVPLNTLILYRHRTSPSL